MKSSIAAIMISLLAGVAETTLASCPTSLTAEQMVDCIVKENAGYTYPLRGKSTSLDGSSVDEPAATATKTDEATVSATANAPAAK